MSENALKSLWHRSTVLFRGISFYPFYCIFLSQTGKYSKSSKVKSSIFIYFFYHVVISRELILSLGLLRLHFEHNAGSGACLEGVQPSNWLPLIIIHSGRSSVIHKVNLNSSLPKSQVQNHQTFGRIQGKNKKNLWMWWWPACYYNISKIT